MNTNKNTNTDWLDDLLQKLGDMYIASRIDPIDISVIDQAKAEITQRMNQPVIDYDKLSDMIVEKFMNYPVESIKQGLGKPNKSEAS